MNRAAIAITVFVTLALGSGCTTLPAYYSAYYEAVDALGEEWPTGAQGGPGVGDVEQGVTTRAQIIRTFGQPLAQTPDQRFVLYNRSHVTTHVVSKDLTFLLVPYKTEQSWYTSWELLEFDGNDRFKRSVSHSCESSIKCSSSRGGCWGDPRCASDPQVALVALVAENYGRALAERYHRSIVLCKVANTASHRTVLDLLAGDAYVNTQCKEVGTPLHVAVSNPNVAILLLAHGAEVNTKDSSGRTPLHLAARGDNLDVAEMLLAYGAEVNTKDSSGRTPLHLAARGDNLDLAILLLAHGADVNAKDPNGRTPLHEAAAKGDSNLLMVLFDHGARVDTKDQHGATPLHEAAPQSDRTVIELIFAHGADVNVKRQDGSTPLHLAASGGNLAAVELLLAQGAEVNAKDNYALTPLHAAVFAGSADVVKVLLDHRADVAARDEFTDRTPLHYAASRDAAAIAGELLAAGAEANAIDEDGKTPIDLASDPKVITLLEQYDTKR